MSTKVNAAAVQKLINENSLLEMIDKLGDVDAQAAPLIARIGELKAAIIIKGGEGRHAGTRYDATVSIYEQERLDMDAVRAKLTPQFIRAHTTTSVVRKCLIFARKVTAFAA